MDRKTEALLVHTLLDARILDEAQIRECLNGARTQHRSPLVLVARAAGYDESQILEKVAPAFHTHYLDLKTLSLDSGLAKTVPVKIASYYQIVPVRRDEQTLVIAVAVPLDIKIEDELRAQLGCSIVWVLSCERDVQDMLKRYYGLGADTMERMRDQLAHGAAEPAAESANPVPELDAAGEDASVIKLVNQIILDAVRKRATDIHIEPYRSRLRVRYRIDGIMYDSHVSEGFHTYLLPILSRIKLMANLNIVERRVPQDGRAVVKVEGQTLDLRISFIPTPYGESAVIRILPAAMLFHMDRLGLDTEEQSFFRELIQKPHGIIFLTGPTGSGKTTTLYACLSAMNTQERKIITIEDPVEYELDGITQIQVAPEVGLDFARGLRSMLRHDPDVMMVGEVRDLETAEIAIRVALTGHLVFSTLHTNDAASGITRLVDIGVEPYLVASSVEAFIAQRLIRTICTRCRREVPAEIPIFRGAIVRSLGIEPERVRIFQGTGCPECNMTGFYGRTAIYEILAMPSAIKKMVLQKAASEDIKCCGMRNRMRTLRQSGWIKVLAGVTTPDEILRVTQSDEHQDQSVELPVAAAVATSAVFPPEAVAEPDPVQPAETDGTAERAGEQSAKDRRVFERLDERVYVRYKIFKSGTRAAAEKAEYEPELVGVSKNISAGGILFAAAEKLAPGTILDLLIELPDEASVQCLSRVVRCRERVPHKEYEAAVCFLDLPNADRSRLNRYVLRNEEKTG